MNEVIRNKIEIVCQKEKGKNEPAQKVSANCKPLPLKFGTLGLFAKGDIAEGEPDRDCSHK